MKSKGLVVVLVLRAVRRVDSAAISSRNYHTARMLELIPIGTEQGRQRP